MATHSSILAWKIPWTEEPDRLQSVGISKSWTWLSDWLSLSIFKSSPLGKEINTGHKGRLTLSLPPSSHRVEKVAIASDKFICGVCVRVWERENMHGGLQSHPRRKLEVYLWFAQGLFPTPIPAPPKAGFGEGRDGTIKSPHLQLILALSAAGASPL